MEQPAKPAALHCLSLNSYNPEPNRLPRGLKNHTDLSAWFFNPREISPACGTAWRGGRQGGLCFLHRFDH